MVAVITNKLLRWVIFGVLVALVPIAFSYLNLIMKSRPPSVYEVLGDGGLLLTISAVCAGALGELIGSGSRALGFKIVASGGTVITLLVSSLLFAAIFEGKLTAHFDEHAVATASAWIFLVGIVPCAACVALSEL